MINQINDTMSNKKSSHKSMDKFINVDDMSISALSKSPDKLYSECSNPDDDEKELFKQKCLENIGSETELNESTFVIN